ncbi:MAG TPA: hypothetical protein VGG83_10590 [Trebonia sp.]|jgi:hypothetical protein
MRIRRGLRARHAALQAEHAAALEEISRLRRKVDDLAGDSAALTHHARAVARQNVEQRAIIADLGRRLHGAQLGPLGDTAPMPRIRSGPPPGSNGDLLVPWRNDRRYGG